MLIAAAVIVFSAQYFLSFPMSQNDPLYFFCALAIRIRHTVNPTANTPIAAITATSVPPISAVAPLSAALAPIPITDFPIALP